MKKFLIASALAALAATTFVSAASAQRSPGNGRDGASSTDGGHGNPSACITAVCDPQVERPRKVIALGEGCGCTVKKVRIGGRISYVQDCYFFDVKANMERYCQPWERSRSN